ncbi:MAG TPA: type III secretion system stator protein SctL [Trinickia sp.]
MILWLRARNGDPHSIDEIAPELPACGVGVESEDDVVRREAFAMVVDLDAAAHEIERQREAILADAQARADALLAEAEAEAERVRAQAQHEYETAAERGYGAGRERGLAEWYERSARSAAGQRRVQSLLRERIVELVVDATEQIVRNVDVSALFARSAEVVERLVEGSTYLRVRVHPDDEPAAVGEFDRLAAIWRERGHGVAVTVVADRAVARGACLCESDLGTVDASLDTQLAALRAAVTRAVKRTAGADDADLVDAGVDLEALADSAARHVEDAAPEVGHDAARRTDTAIDDEADPDDAFEGDRRAALSRAGQPQHQDREDPEAGTEAEAAFDAEMYSDGAAGDGEPHHDPYAIPWLGDPEYDRIAHPDHHAGAGS